MVILSDNIFELKPEAIRNVKVDTTILGGRWYIEDGECVMPQTRQVFRSTRELADLCEAGE